MKSVRVPVGLFAASGILAGLFSCQTPGASSSLAAAAGAPSKPNDLPKTSVNFVASDMVAITEHGGSICKILEKSKTDEFIRIAQKVCDGDNSWLGYTATDGLKDNNELFIGNREALTYLGNKISGVAGQKNNIAIQRLAFLEMTMFRDDVAIISGDKIKKFESDMQGSVGTADAVAKQRSQYTNFLTWAKSLDEHFMKYGNPSASGAK